jgi:cell division protein FtsB
MFRGTPEEWDREWKFRERFRLIEDLLLRHRETLDALAKENRELRKENQRLLKNVGLLRREREKVRDILARMEARMVRIVEKGKLRGGEKED